MSHARRPAQGTLRSRALAALSTLSLCVACASGPESPESTAHTDYVPDRRDYAAFREGYPELIEPNYLPFMLHRFPGAPGEGELLVVCRWDEADMPIPVYIEAPEISEALQDEFHPVPPERYVDRVGRALTIWERELEGRVRFRRVEDPAAALLALRIHGETAPRPSEQVQVLGATAALLGACRVLGREPGVDRLYVQFRVPELDLYVADRSGLLTPNQVERVALHELGHALGMLGHSPIPTDFMYSIFRDRPGVTGLSIEDVNSFLSLYSLPPGTVYARIPAEGPAPRPPPGPPSGPPLLSRAPHVDARIGFEVRIPAGWSRTETRHGFFSANGPVWDHDVSFEIVVWPYETIEHFLARFREMLFADTWLRRRSWLAVNGRRALQMAVEDDDGRHEQEFTFVELGDGRVMMILTRSTVGEAEAWRPWFQAALATLDIWRGPGRSGRP